MNPPIELQLSIDADVLRIVVVNRGETELRVWDRDNSWGWGMFSLLVAAPGSEQWSELTPRPVRRTRNVPRARKTPPGGRLEYDLRPGDPTWEGVEGIADRLDGPLRLRVRLSIPETAEAVEQKVFVGEAESAPVLSTPPHGWLVGPLPGGAA
jgi:hypothetical protein